MSDTEIIEGETALAPANGAPGALARFEPTEEDLALFEGVKVRPPIWQFDAKDGVWRDIDDRETEIAELIGFIGGTWRSRCFFPPRQDSPLYATEGPTWGEQKWLCRAREQGKPPQLNPALTEEQVAMARKLGAGNACATCPLGQWGRTGDSSADKPRCTEFLNASWCDLESERFGVVTVKTFSIRTITKHVAAALQSRKLPCKFNTRLAAAKEKRNGNSYYVATADRAGEVDGQVYAQRAAACRQMHPRIKDDLDFEHRDFGDESEASRSPAPSDVPGEAGGGVDIDPVTGEIVERPTMECPL